MQQKILHFVNVCTICCDKDNLQGLKYILILTCGSQAHSISSDESIHNLEYIEDIQIFGMNMPFISSSEGKNAYFTRRNKWHIHSKNLNFLFIIYSFKRGKFFRFK